jgi:hypothetical protein
MPMSDNNSSFQPKAKREELKTKKQESSKVALGIHSMPKTDKKSFKSWILLGAVILIIIIALFLVLVV